MSVWIAGVGTADVPDLEALPLSRRDKRRLDEPSRLALTAAAKALGQAHLEGVQGTDAGVILGSPWGCTATNDAYLAHIQGEGPPEPGMDPLGAALFKQTVPNAPGAWIALAYGLQGPNRILLGGMDPSAQALEEALFLIEAGIMPWALVGGVDVPPGGQREGTRPWAGICCLVNDTLGQGLGLPSLAWSPQRASSPPSGPILPRTTQSQNQGDAIHTLINHLKGKAPSYLIPCNMGVLTLHCAPPG